MKRISLERIYLEAESFARGVEVPIKNQPEEGLMKDSLYSKLLSTSMVG